MGRKRSNVRQRETRRACSALSGLVDVETGSEAPRRTRRRMIAPLRPRNDA